MKKGITMKTMLILFSMLPMILVTVVLTIVSYNSITSKLEEQTKISLQVASNGLREYYETYSKNGIDFPDAESDNSHSYVDSFSSIGIDLTLFKGDTRHVTSIKDSSGKRIEGTKASDAVISAVLKSGNTYYSDDVVINDTPYYVFYMPIEDDKGDIVGMAFAGKTCSDVQAAKSAVLLSSLLISGVLLVVFIAVVLVLTNLVAKPLGVVSGNLDSIGEGDLSSKTRAKSNVSEIGKLIGAQDKLQSELSSVIVDSKNISEQLVEKITQISELIDGTSVSTDQISSAMNDLAEGTMALASNVQDLNIQVDHLGDCINDISDSINVLANSSDTIKEANDVAMEYMDKVSDSSDKSVESMDSIAKQICETNNAIVKIDEAVGLITSVASQTNLLALNASIEAARAGEAGKGFAVVASEIQKLSEESNRGANQIKSIVVDIKNQSDVSVELSDKVKEIIVQEQSYIRETKDKFELLNNEVSTSVEMIKTITSKNEVLVEVKGQLVSNVNDISAISEENAASNEQVSASLTSIAESVKTISDNSKEMISNANGLNDKFSHFRC